MPTLNSEKAFQFVPWNSSLSEEEKANIPDDWEKRLFELCCETLNLEGGNKAHFNANWNRHLNSEVATYVHLQELKDLLKVIYYHLNQDDFKQDKKYSILQKLNEDIEQCTGGFHIRLKDTVALFRIPHNIFQALSIVRHSIVENAARERTQEVHAYSAFFTIANQLQYGVEAMHQDDPHFPIAHLHSFKQAIEHEFKTEYDVWGMIVHLHEILNNLFCEHFEYKGLEIAGYKTKTYASITNYLSTFFNQGELSIEDVFIIDYENEIRVVEVNWQWIYFKLWETFKIEKIIHCSLAEEAFINVLFNGSMDLEDFIEHGGVLLNILAGHRARINFLNFVNVFSLQTRENLIKTYASRADLKTIPMQLFIDALDFWGVGEGALIFDQAFFDQDIETILMNRKGIEPNALMMASFRNKRIFRHLLNTVSKESLRRFFTEKDDHNQTLLYYITRYCPEELPFLLERVQAFLDAQELKTLLVNQDNFGSNIFNYAILQNPASFVLLYEFIEKNNPEILIQLVTNQDKNGHNCLMQLLSYGYQEADYLISKLTTISMDDLSKILSAQAIYDNCTALHFALLNHGQYLKPLFKLVRRLDESEVDRICSQTRFGNSNIVMECIKNNSLLLKDLIVELNQTRPNTLKNLLMMRDDHSCNPLMIAAWYSRNAAWELLRAMEAHLTKQEFIQLFEQMTVIERENHNALTIAMRRKPEIVPDLLNALLRLENENRDDFAHETTFIHIKRVFEKVGYTVLLLMYQNKITLPAGVAKQLIDCIFRLPKKETIDIVSDAINTMETLNARAFLLAWGVRLFLLVPIGHKLRPDVLSLLECLEPEEQANILKAGACDLFDALMLAISVYPSAFIKLFNRELEKGQALDSISKLEAIFRQQNRESETILIQAAKSKSGILKMLLSPIQSSFTYQVQFQLFSMANLSGLNALMTAIVQQNEDTFLLLLAIKRLSAEQQKTIFLQTTDLDKKNMLMIACQYAPQFLIRLALHLHQDVIESLLCAKDHKGRNVLVISAKHSIEALASILNLIGTLTKEPLKGDIFTDFFIYNKKPIAAIPTDLRETILTMIASLPELEGLKMLQALIKHDKEQVFMEAINHHPNMIEWILTAINSLNALEKSTLLSKLDGEGKLTELAKQGVDMDVWQQLSDAMNPSAENPTLEDLIRIASYGQETMSRADSTSSSSSMRFFSEDNTSPTPEGGLSSDCEHHNKRRKL